MKAEMGEWRMEKLRSQNGEDALYLFQGARVHHEFDYCHSPYIIITLNFWHKVSWAWAVMTFT